MLVKMEEAIKLIRKNELLKEWSDGQIATGITQAIKDFAFSYTVDENYRIDGIVFGKWHSKEIIHISCLIGKFNVFLEFLKSNFPNCKKIVAMRNGVHKEYNI